MVRFCLFSGSEIRTFQNRWHFQLRSWKFQLSSWIPAEFLPLPGFALHHETGFKDFCRCRSPAVIRNKRLLVGSVCHCWCEHMLTYRSEWDVLWVSDWVTLPAALWHTACTYLKHMAWGTSEFCTFSVNWDAGFWYLASPTRRERRGPESAGCSYHFYGNHRLLDINTRKFREWDRDGGILRTDSWSWML